MTTPNNHKQWKTPLVCLCFLAVGIPGALLARQYILAQPGLPAHPEISDSTNAGNSEEDNKSNDFLGMITSPAHAVGTISVDADPLGINPPPESKRVYSHQRKSKRWNILEAKYIVASDLANIEQYYTDKLLALGFECISANTNSRGTRFCSFNRNRTRTEVSLRKCQPDGKIVIMLMVDRPNK